MRIRNWEILSIECQQNKLLNQKNNRKFMFRNWIFSMIKHSIWEQDVSSKKTIKTNLVIYPPDITKPFSPTFTRGPPSPSFASSSFLNAFLNSSVFARFFPLSQSLEFILILFVVYENWPQYWNWTKNSHECFYIFQVH